jgi:predicted helicase
MTSTCFLYDENSQYILGLLLSVITVSIKAVDIVASLPKVEWE